MVNKVINSSSKVTINVIPELDARKIAETIERKIQSEYYRGLQEAMKSTEIAERLVIECIRILNKMQREYWSGASSIILEEDPTQFGDSEQHSKIRSEVLENFQKAIVSENGVINFIVLKQEFITGDKKSKVGIPWLYHFLEGNIDNNLVWIDKEVAAKAFGIEGSLGRFGDGVLFQITNEDSFNKKLEESGLDTSKYNYSTLKHPQSGKEGQPWFATVVKDSGIAELVQQKALSIMKSRLI